MLTTFKNWIGSILLTTSFNFLFQNDGSIGKCPYPKDMNFCSPSKASNSIFCTLGQIEASNQKPYYVLEKLLHEPFFRYFKVKIFERNI